MGAEVRYPGGVWVSYFVTSVALDSLGGGMEAFAVFNFYFVLGISV